MTDIIETLREAKRLRLIATAIELLEFERISSAAIPIPGTAPQRYVMVGDTTTVARLLEIDGDGTRRKLADDTRFRQMMQEFLIGDLTVEQVAARIEGWSASGAKAGRED